MKTQLAALALTLATAASPQAFAKPDPAGPVIGTVTAKTVILKPESIRAVAYHDQDSAKVLFTMNMFGNKSTAVWDCPLTRKVNQTLDQSTTEGWDLRREFVKVAVDEVVKTAGSRRINLKVDHSQGPVYQADVRPRFIDEASSVTVDTNRVAIRAAAWRCERAMQ